MDFVKAPLLLLLGVLVESSFWGGVAQFLSAANIPHSAADLGAAFGAALFYVAAQAWQIWNNRKMISNQVQAAVAGHLAALAAQPPPDLPPTPPANAL